MNNCKLTVVTWSILVDALCKEGRAFEAEDIVERMLQQSVEPNIVTYSSLMDGYCLQGEMDEARRIFNSMANKDFYNIIY